MECKKMETSISVYDSHFIPLFVVEFQYKQASFYLMRYRLGNYLIITLMKTYCGSYCPLAMGSVWLANTVLVVPLI